MIVRAMSTKGELLKTGEAAKLLNVSLQTVRDWTEQGKLDAHISEGGHRKYFEADVKRLVLEERGIESLVQATQKVGMDRNGDFYFINDDWQITELDPFVERIFFKKYWNYTNGLQSFPHMAVLKDEPSIVENNIRGAFVCEANGEPMVCLAATVVGVERDKVVAKLPKAIEQAKVFLANNYSARVTYHWYDSRGHLVSP